jgi:iron complex outermembrane receptor protein
LSTSAYYNLYDDLKAIEITPVTFVPLFWSNAMKGHSYGLETWGDLSLTDWWKMSAGVSLLHEDLRFKAGASGILGTAQAGDDPRHQEMLSSTFNVGHALTIKLDFRHVGHLPDPHVPAYSELGGRVAWRLNDRLQLSLSGLNLLHAWHQELPDESANQVPRTLLAGLKWRM